jgi:hypothetical protein
MTGLRITGESPSKTRRVLDPIDRLSEVLFGLIMVLTFTGSLSVAESGRDDIRAMLIGALGCNLAWGIIDGVFYLMGSLAERARQFATLRAVRDAGSPQEARQIIVDTLPPIVASNVDPDEFEGLRARLAKLPAPPVAQLRRDDWLGAVGVFLLVFLSTFPVTIPFIVMRNAVPALRVSNAIAIALLFATGYAFGRLTGRTPAVVGVAMVVLGGVMVGLTIALGG